MRRGVVLLEVLMALIVIGLTLALLTVGAQRQRRLAGATESIANLRQLGVSHASYGNDNASRVATFSWRTTDVGLSQYPDLNGPFAQNLASAGAQAVDIMRRRGGGNATSMPPIPNWVPHVLYSHLVLVDYLGQDSPSPFMVSPGDAARLDWRRTGQGPQSETYPYRWVHSSSYELPPCFFSPDYGNSTGTKPCIGQAFTYDSYQTYGDVGRVAGTRRYDELAYPSQKVMMFEQFQRFEGPRDAFFAYPEARVPALLSDGSAGVRRTDEANKGQSPVVAYSPKVYTTFLYFNPKSWEPAPLYSPAGDTVIGYFRWTRMGLLGRDFDGPETPGLK